MPTPNLGLSIRTGTDDFDFNEVNADNTTLDTAIGITVCTSATRPVSLLFRGRRIFETDTNNYYFWDGAAWLLDLAGAVTVCTSATRPVTGNYHGRRIYETDTTAWYFWDGDSWVWDGFNQLLPKPIRADLLNGASGTITATTPGTQLPGSTTYGLVLAKAMYCDITCSALVSSVAGAATTTLGRLKWTGATTGNSHDLFDANAFGNGFFQGGSPAGNTFAPYGQQRITFRHLFAAGTTTFSIDAWKGAAGTGGNINYARLEITPVRYTEEVAP